LGSRIATVPPPLWNAVFVDEVAKPEHAKYQSRSIREIADELGVAPADAAACASYSAVGRGVAPGVAAVCAGSTVAAAAGDAPEDGAVASTFDDPGGADSGFVLDSRPSPIEAGAASRGADSSNGHGPAGHASMKMAALAPAEAQEHEAAAAPAPAPTPALASQTASCEVGGREGPEPTRFGDWELRGRCIDF